MYTQMYVCMYIYNFVHCQMMHVYQDQIVLFCVNQVNLDFKINQGLDWRNMRI